MYDLHILGWHSFQQLCLTITREIFGQTVESFLDFHVVGILFGSAMFGWVLHRLQRAFERSRSSIEIYIWQYLSVWTCFLIFGFGSIGVQSQVMIYYCWPIYAFWCAAKKWRLLIRLQSATNQRA